MPREERRAAIVETTMPLLEQHGDQLTTKQVAEAAGVAEGTIFRAFDSLQDVIDATVTEALTSARLAGLLESQHFPGDLDGDTRAALEAITRYHASIKTMVHLGHTSPSPTASCARDQLTDRHRELTQFLVQRFTAHADDLAISPARFAGFLFVLAFGKHGQVALGNLTFDIDALAELALAGARKDPR